MPLALGLILALAPPIPLPKGGLPNFSAKTEEEEEKAPDRSGRLQQDERPRAVVIAEQLPNDPAVSRPLELGGAGFEPVAPAFGVEGLKIRHAAICKTKRDSSLRSE